MSKRKSARRTAPATPAELKMSQRQRERAKRALLKRRRAKSGQ